MDAQDAEEFTQALGQLVAGSFALARRLGIPEALGLSVEQWVNERLCGYVKLSRMDEEIDIKRLREERGWSQEQLAEYLCLDRSTVSRMETGRKPRGPVLKLLRTLK